jgi:hypothetical protein
LEYADRAKSFLWRRNGEATLGGVKTPDLPLYRSEHIKEFDPGKPVYVCEGEKATDAAAKAGLQALGTVTGAAATPSATSLEVLRNRHVILWPDADAPGSEHMRRIGDGLKGIASSVRTVRWSEAPSSGDAFEFFAQGGTLEQLRSIEEETQPREPDMAGPVIIRLADVEPEEVEWLWPGRIPFGKITMFDGDPGLGKSLVSLDLAARLTKGLPFPLDGEERREPSNVLLLSAEDGAADTIRPRFDAAGGDAERIFLVKAIRTEQGGELAPSISLTLPDIKMAIRKTSARLLIIDPLAAHLGPTVNSFRDQDVRQALGPLARMAEELQVAVILVRHLNKGRGLPGIYRGGGSIGIIGAARAAFLFAADSEYPEKRFVAALKSNLGLLPSTLAYRVVPSGSVARVEWEPGEVNLTADEILAASNAGPEDRTRREEARNFLRVYLSDGPHPVENVIKAAKSVGISEKTLRRAAKDLGVRSDKDGFSGGWTWGLPVEDGQGKCEDGQDGHIWKGGHLRESWPSSAPAVPKPCSYPVGRLANEGPPGNENPGKRERDSAACDTPPCPVPESHRDSWRLSPWGVPVCLLCHPNPEAVSWKRP